MDLCLRTVFLVGDTAGGLHNLDRTMAGGENERLQA